MQWQLPTGGVLPLRYLLSREPGADVALWIPMRRFACRRRGMFEAFTCSWPLRERCLPARDR